MFRVSLDLYCRVVLRGRIDDTQLLRGLKWYLLRAAPTFFAKKIYRETTMNMKEFAVVTALTMVLAACQPSSEQAVDRASSEVEPLAASRAQSGSPRVMDLPDVAFDIDLHPRRRASYASPSGEQRLHIVFEYLDASPDRARATAMLALREAGYRVRARSSDDALIFSRGDLNLGSLRVVAADGGVNKGRYIINLPDPTTP